MEVSHGCYCCTKPLASGMDVDSALHELGMLSSVTNSRKQYLRERIHRSRNMSESGTSRTPCSSPTKAGYQVVQMNPKFITGLSTANPSNSKCPAPAATPDSLKENQISQSFSTMSIGHKFSQDSVETQAKVLRLSRVKVSRVRRFRKPYEVPWRACMETRYSNVEHHDADSVKAIYPPKVCRESENATGASSCVSTAAKEPTVLSTRKGPVTVQRSRSLDDLEFAKLRLADDNEVTAQGQTPTVKDRQDIDNVSQHLKDLHMFE